MTEGVKIIMHKEYWKEYNFYILSI